MDMTDTSTFSRLASAWVGKCTKEVKGRVSIDLKEDFAKRWRECGYSSESEVTRELVAMFTYGGDWLTKVHTERSEYQRMTPRPKLVTPPAPAPETEPQQEAATPPATTTAAAKPAAKPATKPELHPLKQVEALAAEARAIAQRAGELAARIEDLALDFEQRMEVVASETKKLRQLQELLRSIA